MNIIGIDPSLTATGIAAIDLQHMDIVDWACIHTKPDANMKKIPDTARRVLEIRDGIRTFQERNRGLIAIEAQVPSAMGKKNAKSSFGKGLAYGISIGLTTALPIIVTPREMRVRRGLTVNASKTELWNACLKELAVVDGLEELKTIPMREAVHDAAAVALAAKLEAEQLQALIA